MNRRNIEKPLEEVREWKRAISRRISKMTPVEEIKYFNKSEAKTKKSILISKAN